MKQQQVTVNMNVTRPDVALQNRTTQTWFYVASCSLTPDNRFSIILTPEKGYEYLQIVFFDKDNNNFWSIVDAHYSSVDLVTTFPNNAFIPLTAVELEQDYVVSNKTPLIELPNVIGKHIKPWIYRFIAEFEGSS